MADCCLPVYPSSSGLERAYGEWVRRVAMEDVGDICYLTPVLYNYCGMGVEDVTDAYIKLGRGNGSSFLFEVSNKSARGGRFSIISTDFVAEIRIGPNEDYKGDPLMHLEEISRGYRVVNMDDFLDEKSIDGGQSPFSVELLPSIVYGGFLGYVGYECVKYFERGIKDSELQIDQLKIPESAWFFPSSLVVFCHRSKRILITALAKIDPHSFENTIRNYQSSIGRIDRWMRILDSPIPPLTGQLAKVNFCNGIGVGGDTSRSRDGSEYRSNVGYLKERICGGECIQVVISNRIYEDVSDLDPFDIFCQLREINMSKYAFYLDYGDFKIAGCSPELLVRVEDGIVLNNPIAGTRRRGSSPEEDEAIISDLLSDQKELAEHVMLVDLGRNDVNRVSDPFSTRVDSFMNVELYSHVIHIVSEISGRLRPEFNSFDAFRSIFPAGTVSGAPKVRAMQLIQSLERFKRSFYSGALGYFSFKDSVDTCIILRSFAVVNGMAYLQSGGGVVLDSVEENEYQETIDKIAAVLRAIEKCRINTKMPKKDPQIAPNSKNPVLFAADKDDKDFSEYHKNLMDLEHILPPGRYRSPIYRNYSISRKIDDYKRCTVVVDNYDSFTWNLYQYLRILGENVVVIRNTESLEDILHLEPEKLLISPGPGFPKDSGISMQAIKHFCDKIPILGVCLGLQCMVELFGGKVVQCPKILHGKTSVIEHDGLGIYKDIPNLISVTRYHSLVADCDSIPEDFIVTSRTRDGIIMGIRHKRWSMEAVQFHPESIITDHGLKLIENWLSSYNPGSTTF